MASARSRLLGIARQFGVDPLRTGRSLCDLPAYVSSLRAYRAGAGVSPRFPLRVREIVPALGEQRQPAGAASGHYFHQDLWAARRVFAVSPDFHMDVGSRVDGFVAHVLTFMPVTAVDIRPLASGVEGLTFIQDDATALAAISSDSIVSLSSLHAVEHFGLGRYGDQVDPEACQLAMRSLARILAPGGRLYFSVPVGRERVEFNSHRVFDPKTVLAAFDDLTLIAFAAVDDGGQLRVRCCPDDFARANYACGLFEFRK